MMSGDVAQEHIDRIPPKSEAWSGSHGHSPPSFFASVVAITGGQLGCIAVASLAELCFARLLGPSSRGLVSLCLMSIAFGALIGSLGSEATVVVWISRSKGRHSTWFPAVVLWVLSGCLLAVSAWAVVYWKWHP